MRFTRDLVQVRDLRNRRGEIQTQVSVKRFTWSQSLYKEWSHRPWQGAGYSSGFRGHSAGPGDPGDRRRSKQTPHMSRETYQLTREHVDKFVICLGRSGVGVAFVYKLVVKK